MGTDLLPVTTGTIGASAGGWYGIVSPDHTLASTAVGGLPGGAPLGTLVLPVVRGQGQEMVGVEDSQHRVLNVKTMSGDLDRAGVLWDVSMQFFEKATLGVTNKHNGRPAPDPGDARPRPTVRVIPLVTQASPSKRCPWNMAAIRAVIHEKGYLQQLLRMDAQWNGELLIP